ncbi:MAG: WD40 repeat domain-containing protein [Bacteroidia bacterium]|nr:WD40 repeat domain-containing protein [Bacteroidia bacterium]
MNRRILLGISTLALLVCAFFLLPLRDSQSTAPQAPNQNKATLLERFAGKKSLKEEFTAINQAASLLPAFETGSEPSAEELAQLAWDLRFQRPDVSLHLISRALQISDSPAIGERAQAILDLNSYRLSEDWVYENEPVQALAVTKDKKLIALGTEYGVIILLNERGEVISETSAHENTIDALAFSPDGKMLAAGSHDNDFSLWKVKDGSLKEDARHLYGEDWVRDLAFTPNGKQLLVVGDMYYGLVYDMDSREVTDSLGDHDYYVFSIAISSDGTQAVSGDGEGLFKVWKQRNGRWTAAGSTRLAAKINDLSYATDGSIVAALDGGAIVSVSVSAAGTASVKEIASNREQDFLAITTLDGSIIAGGNGARVEQWKGEVGIVCLVPDMVQELLPWSNDKFLVATGSAVMLGSILPSNTGTVEELKAGTSLPELSLDDKLVYNLWREEDVANLDAQGKISLFETIQYVEEVEEARFLDINGLSTLYVEKAVETISDYQSQTAGNQEIEEVMRAILQTSGNKPMVLNKAAEIPGDASQTLMWVAMAGTDGNSTELRKYAAKRAYALSPSKSWGELLAAGFNSSLEEIEEPDMALTYQCDANSVSYSPDGSHLYVSTDRAEECEGGYLYPVKLGFPVQTQELTFPNQSGIMWQARFSGDGQRIVSPSTDGTVIVYTLTGGTEHIFANDGGEVGFLDAQVRRQGDVITGDANGRVIQWKLGGIRPQAVLMEHSGEVRKIVLADQEKTILSIGYDGYLRIYKDNHASELLLHEDGLEDIDVNKAQTKLLIGYVGGGAAVLDLQSMEVQEIEDNDGSDFQCVAFSPDAQTLYAGTESGILKAFSPGGTLKWQKKVHDGALYDLSISPDGKVLATAGGDDRVTFWNMGSLGGGTDLWTTLDWKAHPMQQSDWAGLLSIAGRSFSQEKGREFVQSLFDATPKGESKEALENSIEGSLFFDLEGKNVKSKGGLAFYQGVPQSINGLAWSPEKKAAIVMGDGGGFFMLEDNGSFSRIASIETNTDNVRCMTRLADGRWAAGESGHITVLSADFVVEKSISMHEGMIYDIAGSPDGAYIATASADHRIGIVDVATWEVVYVSGHSDEVNTLAFLPNGAGLVSGADDQSLRFWDIQGNLKRTVDLEANIWSVAISPDSERIVCGTNEGEIILVDGTGANLKRWRYDEYSIWTLVFSPDGSSFAMANNDGEVMLFSKDGEQKFMFDTGNSTIFDATFSSDGKFLFVGTTEGEAFRFGLE